MTDYWYVFTIIGLVCSCVTFVMPPSPEGRALNLLGLGLAVFGLVLATIGYIGTV